MPSSVQTTLRMKSANFIKDSEVAEFFPSNKDPEIRYEERREIGHGAFGAVYYVRQLNLIFFNRLKVFRHWIKKRMRL